jgi:hypothetical protein
MGANYVPSQITDINGLNAALKAGSWSVISNNPIRPSARISSSSFFTETGRIEVVPPFDIVAVRLVYANWYTGGTGETPNTNPICITATVQPRVTTVNEVAGDPTIPVTFGGKSYIWLGRGKIAISDPVYIGVPAGQRFYVKSSPNNALPAAPPAPTVNVSGSGSAFSSGNTCHFSITYVYPDGIESLASATTSASIASSGQNFVVTSPTAVAGAIGYRVWMSYVGATTPQYDAGSGTVPFGTNFTVTRGLPSATAQNIEQVEGGGPSYYPVGSGVLGGTGAGSANNGEGFTNGVNWTPDGRAVTAQGAGNKFGPTAVLAIAADGELKKSVGLIGDSIMSAAGDNGFGWQRGGFIVRAITGQLSRAYDANIVPNFGHVMVAQGSESASQFAGPAGMKRTQLASLCTTVVSNYGTNDLSNGSAQVCGNIWIIGKRFTDQGKKFIQTTLDPRTSQSPANGWQTISGQTVTAVSEGARRAINNWIISNTGQTVITNEAPFRIYAGSQGPGYNFYGGSTGTIVSFATSHPFIQGTESVTVNGAEQAFTSNYTYYQTFTVNGINYASGITFTSAPADGSDVRITFTKMAGLCHSGNGLSGLADHWDTASAVEVDANGNNLLNGGWVKPLTTIHIPSRNVTAATSTVITDSTQSWTQDQWRGYCMMITADSSTPAAVGQVRCIQFNSATQLTTNTAFSPAPSASAQYAIISTNMTDGTHVSTEGHIAKAQAVDLTKIM